MPEFDPVGHHGMTEVLDERDRIRAAMDRILSGCPERAHR